MLVFVSKTAMDLVCEELSCSRVEYSRIVYYYIFGSRPRAVEFVLRVNRLFPGYMGMDGGSKRIINGHQAYWAEGVVEESGKWKRIFQPTSLFDMTKGAVEERSKMRLSDFQDKFAWIRELLCEY